MNFKLRSFQKELLDEENIPTADLYQNLKELAFINTYLGGFDCSVKGVSQLIKDKARLYHIVDIGCGGGDNMLAIATWAAKNKIAVKLTGIDMKADAIAYSTTNCCSHSNLHFIKSDYQSVIFNEPVDIIISSLFCHHLNTIQFQECLVWMQKNAKVGFLINDLERNKIAYYSIKWLTKVFSNSYLVKNDAPLSVRRGFTRNEIETQLIEAGIKSYSIKWVWAFRYLVLAVRNEH